MSDEESKPDTSIAVEDPSGGESNFAGIVTAISFEEAVEYLSRVVPGAVDVDPDVIGEIVAGALSIGGYAGAELACNGIEPPPEERTEFSRKFPMSSAAIQRVRTAAEKRIRENLKS